VTMSLLAFTVGAYLLGAIPFGLLIGLARGVDIRAHGSSNIGATNAGRVLGRKWGYDLPGTGCPQRVRSGGGGRDLFGT